MCCAFIRAGQTGKNHNKLQRDAVVPRLNSQSTVSKQCAVLHPRAVFKFSPHAVYGPRAGISGL